MGKLPLTVTVSAVIHGGVVVWVGTRDISIDHVQAPATAVTVVELVGAPPLEVSMTTGAPASAGIEALPTRPGASRELSTSASTSTSTSTSASTSASTSISPESSDPGLTRSPYLDMRRGNPRADLSLPATRDDLDNVPAGTEAKQPNTRGAHEDDKGTFVARVDRDGDVSFEDRSDVDVHIAVPTPKLIGKGIAEWYLSDKGEDGKRGKRTLENEVGGNIDKGSIDGVDKGDQSGRTVIVPVFRGGFNPTDWLMRRTVGDPYASKKRAYLDATRDERAQIRSQHRTEQLAQAAVIMRGNLERAWASTRDVRLRKELLFELWDEVVEPADEGSAIAEASRAARAQVIGFIRARLPQRGANAYTRDEIAALNARKQSIETFAPYE